MVAFRRQGAARPAYRVPWTIKVLRVAGLLLPLLAVGLPCTNMLRDANRDDAATVPSDVCAMLPANLLDRLVPSAGERDVQASNGYQQTNRARCWVSTVVDNATSTAGGSLSIELARSPDRSFMSAENSAQDDFALDKQWRLSDAGGRVSDVSGLGSAAYLVVMNADASDQEHRRVAVQIAVLRRDAVLTVYLSAAPTTEEIAAAAVVTAARTILAGLR